MDPLQGNQQGISAPGGTENEKPEMDVRVSNDRLTAYLTVEVKQPDQILSYQEVIDFIKSKGIVFGICEDSIRDFCEKKKYFLELPCARGLAPIDEEDADMEYLFQTDRNGLPVEREDGTVDFRDLGLVQNVKKGDVLCRIIPPQKGKDGLDLFNKPIPHKKGRMPKFPSGKNTVISENGLELSAAIDGCIEYKNMILNVNETFIVRGNVDSSCGNIDFLGSVIVQGDVMEGFTVKAGGDITIRGMVEGATLSAGGSISITNGVNGMHGGKLSAGGNIRAKYFQNAVLNCQGDVIADVIMNSNVSAAHSIILRGPSARIMGGKCSAGKQIYANYIGSENYVRTDICLDSPELTRILAGSAASAEEISELNQKIIESQQKIDTLKTQIDTVNRVIAAGNKSEKMNLLIRALTQQQQQAADSIKDFQEQIERIRQTPQDSTVDYSIVGIKIVYTGTKIMIGSYAMPLANDYSNSKFYIEKGQITAGPVLPSDRLSM